MSFTGNIKTELINIKLSNLEQIAELSGLLRNSKEDGNDLIINTENSALARFIFNSLKNDYNALIRVSVKRGYNYNKNYIYGLEIYRNSKKIIDDLCLSTSIPDLYIIDDEDTKRAYLRGLFLGCGSINDPKKSRYHMEFSINDEDYAIFINTILNSYNLNSKILKRDLRYIIYIKEAEKISDFLRLINAVNALLYYENIRIYRSRKNNLNRLNNCEQANVDKMIATAQTQINDIRFLKENNAFDLLDDKVKEACEYRIKYPDVSLLELSKIMSLETESSITKSGLHHRFDKMKQIVNKMKKPKT